MPIVQAANVKMTYFFDRPTVMKALNSKEKRVLSRTGAFVSGAMRRSLGRSGGKKGIKSQPGEPPRKQKLGLLHSRTFFSYDPDSHSVVVGPEYLGKSKSSTQPVPAVLEFGGDVTTPSGQTGFIEPRPYIRPLEELAQKTFREQMERQPF